MLELLKLNSKEKEDSLTQIEFIVALYNNIEKLNEGK